MNSLCDEGEAEMLRVALCDRLELQRHQAWSKLLIVAVLDHFISLLPIGACREKVFPKGKALFKALFLINPEKRNSIL